jgi:hypothetical protein
MIIDVHAHCYPKSYMVELAGVHHNSIWHRLSLHDGF